MENVKIRIAKLLALSKSSNENEAKVALLRAQELMGKYKLHPEEFETISNQKVVRETVGIYCTTLTNPWAVSLSHVIAKNHCCICFTAKGYKRKNMQIGFIGLENDFSVVKQIYQYAYSTVLLECERLTKTYKKKGFSASDIRKICNAYGNGFAKGLKEAYQTQIEQVLQSDRPDSEKWALALCIPAEVSKVAKEMGAKTFSYSIAGWTGQFAEQGFQDGKRFYDKPQLQ